ncbi:MAG: extracellular solute-binding protein [Pseudomonadota bacterium]
MLLRSTLLAAGLALAATPAAEAACAFENETPIKTLSAGFEAWKAVTTAMAECGNVQSELDQEFRTKQPAAFAANPALYHIGGVANGTIVPLIKDGSIRPLDALVEAHGQQLTPNQLVTIDGEIMAIAMMVNAQHLMYRTDVFEDLGLPVPANYEEMFAAAATIKDAGLMDYPIGATLKAGWNLAQEFNNLFLAHGGTFFVEGAQPNVNSDAGVAALETMKAMTDYMDPEFLVSDSTYVQKQMQQGEIAMTNLWSSRAGAMNDPGESSVVGKVGFAGAPAAVAGGPSATTVWWDGIVVAENISDEEAEAAFIVAMEGMDREMVEANQDAAVWLIDGYKVGDLATGVVESLEGGAPSYPASTEIGLMHTALGDNLAAYLTGQASASETLARVEAAYLTAANEAGIIR